jgi:hypothetical protein
LLIAKPSTPVIELRREIFRGWAKIEKANAALVSAK